MERAGFKKVTREAITLQAADRLNLDIQLHPATLSDSITVTDSRFGQLNPEQDNAPRVIALVIKVLF